MNISIREAFLGTQQQKDWVKPLSNRLIIFSEDGYYTRGGRWESLVKAYPDMWKTSGGRLVRVDAQRFPWYRIGNTTINMERKTGDLGQEVATYIYDTQNASIIFDHKKFSTEELEELKPWLEEFIDSGADSAKLP